MKNASTEHIHVKSGMVVDQVVVNDVITPKARYRLVLEAEDLVALLGSVLDINTETAEISCVSGEVAFPLPMQLGQLVVDWEDRLEWDDEVTLDGDPL